MTETIDMGMLSMRLEGKYWKAYYTFDETLTDAVLVGMIHIGAVENSPARKAAFLQLMQDAVAEVIEVGTGVRPDWGDPEPNMPEPQGSA